MELGPHVAPMETWLFLRPFGPHPLPCMDILPNTSEEIRLPHTPEEYQEKDAKILVHHIFAKLPHLFRLQISHGGEVGTLSRPQRGRTQAQQDGGRDQGVPAERPSKDGERDQCAPTQASDSLCPTLKN